MTVLPVHWDRGRVKWDAITVAGATPPTDDDSFWLEGDDPRGTPFVSIADMSRRERISATAKSLSCDGLAARPMPIGRPGTLLFAMYASVGELAFLDITATWNQALLGIMPDTSRIDSRFLRYVLLDMRDDLLRDVRSNTQANLNAGQVRDIWFPRPPLEEQRAIADYLDRETTRIDTLIEEQQGLIKTLRVRRKAVIEQAVFSGLQSAPTRCNTEPWLPPTPSHWQVVQLGYVSDTLAGYAFPSDGFSADGDHVCLLRGVNVKPGRIDWADVVRWDIEAAPVPAEFMLEAGDLVFGMDRPFVGGGVRVAAVSGEDLPALLLQRVMRIRPRSEARHGYMRYLMSADAFFNYLEPLFTGVSVPHVSEWQVRKFKMPLPPLDEQEQISAFLDGQITRIDRLIGESERLIELSRERRAALITAAVTGQIHVAGRAS